MKILCIGDIVGKPGREAVDSLLSGLKKEFNVDFIMANAENSAGGFGTTPRIANELFRFGCHVLTMGDHVWDKEDLKEFLNTEKKIVRPANFPDGTPGRGWSIIETDNGVKVGIINLLGRVFMRYNVKCPFAELKAIVEDLKKQVKIIIVDFHAEATSEKIALGHFIDGEISAIVGTHTHVQTADEQILPKGTAYITDLGMSGPHDSVIGQNKEKIIRRFIKSMPERFEVAENNVILHGVVVDVDEKTGKANSIKRVRRRLSESTT